MLLSGLVFVVSWYVVCVCVDMCVLLSNVLFSVVGLGCVDCVCHAIWFCYDIVLCCIVLRCCVVVVGVFLKVPL